MLGRLPLLFCVYFGIELEHCLFMLVAISIVGSNMVCGSIGGFCIISTTVIGDFEDQLKS